MKVAIVHYWLIASRGGEKVVEEISGLFPAAHIYTHVLDYKKISSTLSAKKISTSFINKLPYARLWYKNYLPLMPVALEQFDFKGYDLVISSESGPAKGVITSPETVHICYCHTPMRYIWEMSHDYFAQSSWIKRIFMAPLLHYIRIWDRLSADRVDCFIANSNNVARRIQKHYRRNASVVYPPVGVEAFSISEDIGDFYLMVGQLVGYKRADLVVSAFNESGKKLVIIGEGEQMKLLRKIAGPNITLLGRQSFGILKDYYAKCRALLFPGEEDFGIVPVEAMASGRPVIAYARGGALETVVDGETGIFFDDQSEEAVLEAVERFEKMEGEFVPERIREHAFRFGKDRFRTELMEIIETRLEEHKRLMRVDQQNRRVK